MKSVLKLKVPTAEDFIEEVAGDPTLAKRVRIAAYSKNMSSDASM